MIIGQLAVSGPVHAWGRIVAPVMFRLLKSGDWSGDETFTDKLVRVAASCAVAQGNGVKGDMMQGWLLAQILDGYVPKETAPEA